MQREETIAFLKTLRNDIRQAFEAFEPKERFQPSSWNYQKGSGGGEMSVLRGEVFEKAAVNFSAVEGPQFPQMNDGNDAEGPFFATGISLITHMQNPHVPTVHMNIRYIETAKRRWLGGGYDLTPMGFPYPEDTEHFHSIARKATGALYPEFSENAKKYFYIPHYKKERGVGGLFFDHLDLSHVPVWKNVGLTFLDAIVPLIERRHLSLYTEEEKKVQLKMRAHYVEFNLLYDRGTKFGFLSGGNPEAILCSMPPQAAW